jgi:hypothetical protein
MALHASGMDHILFASSSEIKLDKKKAAFKKADLTSLLDIEEDEIESFEEVENELEHEHESFILFTSCSKRSLLWERAQAHLFNSFKRKHSFKLPLFIPFENYRL